MSAIHHSLVVWLTIGLRFMAFTWTASVGKNYEAIGILKAGLEANPDRCVVYFAFVSSAHSNIQFLPDLHLR